MLLKRTLALPKYFGLSNFGQKLPIFLQFQIKATHSTKFLQEKLKSIKKEGRNMPKKEVLGFCAFGSSSPVPSWEFQPHFEVFHILPPSRHLSPDALQAIFGSIQKTSYPNRVFLPCTEVSTVRQEK